MHNKGVDQSGWVPLSRLILVVGKAKVKSKLTTIWLMVAVVAASGCEPPPQPSSQEELKLPAEIGKGSDEDLVSRCRRSSGTLLDFASTYSISSK